MSAQNKRSLPIGTVLLPVPAVMVSCGELGKSENIITIAWVGTVCSDPPMIAIGVRPERHSYHLIEKSKEFVVNIPSVATVPAVQQCGILSGKDGNKFSAANLTGQTATIVSAPLIKECPVNIECKVVNSLNLGSHILFIGEVVAVHADENVIKPNGGLDVEKINPIAYAAGEYWNIGDKITIKE